jgi:hypothetical protein
MYNANCFKAIEKRKMKTCPFKLSAQTTLKLYLHWWEKAQVAVIGSLLLYFFNAMKTNVNSFDRRHMDFD